MLESTLKDMDQKSEMYMGKIKSSTRRMETLIRDVLAFSIVSKNSGLIKKVDLNTVMREVENENELQIARKHAVFTYSKLPTINAVSSQMIQLFSNLVSNSLKYSMKDVAPKISVIAQKLKKDEVLNYPQLSIFKNYYKIQLSDNGIGFDVKYAERIFKIFQRLHGKNEYEGTGIGLSICQKIVYNHQGEIIASPGLSGGAVFTIIIPSQG